MSEQIEPDKAGPDALRVATEVLAAQVFALHRIFFRAAKGAVSGTPRSLYDARKALKAQARCRATFKVLLALRAAAGTAEKFSYSSERTIQTPKTPCATNSLPGHVPPASAPAPSRLGRRTPSHRNRWSPERRARQAAAIRTWQPWRKSTGPQTQDGKARSARNALKHGHRSRAYLEMLREDRRVLNAAADNIAIGKAFLRAPSLPAAALATCPPEHAVRRAETGHSIGIGRASRSLIPSRLAILGESRPRRHLPPADTANPRRRWRIAS